MWHIWDTERVLTGFWRGDLMERDHLEWRRIHNKELYDLYSSSNNFLVMK